MNARARRHTYSSEIRSSLAINSRARPILRNLKSLIEEDRAKKRTFAFFLLLLTYSGAIEIAVTKK